MSALLRNVKLVELEAESAMVVVVVEEEEVTKLMEALEVQALLSLSNGR